MTQLGREMRNGHRAAVLWFTGLSGAGKSTVAQALERRLFALLSRLGVPLLHLSRQSGDLEQVFLQAIADE